MKHLLLNLANPKEAVYRNKRRLVVFLLGCFILAGIYTPVQAQQGRDFVFEQEIWDRLQAINPDAVLVFQQATEALDAGDFQAARTSYEQVLELAPDFPDALRRLSQAEFQLGLDEDALAHAQKAFDLAPTSANKITLAQLLVATDIPQNTMKALNLAKEAVQETPDDSFSYNILMFAAAVEEDVEALRTACEALFRLVPEYPTAHFYYSFVLADEGKWEQAEAEMLKARQLGMEAEFVDNALKETGIAQQALFYRSLRWSGYVIAAWLLGLLLLFLGGLGLSKITLAAVENARSKAYTDPSRAELFVRSVYRAVISLTSAYFYLSIPILIFIVAVGGIGLIYLLLIQETFSLRLVLFIGIAVLVTLFAILRGVFTRIKQQEPGRSLAPAEAPALWKLTEAVAARLHIQPIQAIYLTPGTEIAVFQQGGRLQKPRGKGKRSLLLGLGVLSDMTQGQFKSILAHEYGHFIGKDTAGGDLAFRVLRSIQMIILNLAASGQARWYNPAWWFVRGFYNLFLRITLGASRLQEILADRFAAVNYGTRNFIEGLRHVIRQSIKFDLQANKEIKQAIENKVQIQNLYALPGSLSGEDIQALEEAFQKAIDKQTGSFDSHPSPAERFQFVEQLHVAEGFGGLDDERPALELLSDVESLQEEMTATVQARLDERRRVA